MERAIVYTISRKGFGYQCVKSAKKYPGENLFDMVGFSCKMFAAGIDFKVQTDFRVAKG